MPYVTRNAQNEITAIYKTKQVGAEEYLSIENEELINFINKTADHDHVKAVLSSSDADLIRVIEDLINTLIDKGTILFTDLPLPAQEKLVNREKIRGHLNSLDDLMGNDEGIL